MEAIVLAVVCVAPWFFGSVETQHEFALYGVLALLLALWGLRAVVEGVFTWKKCPVALCLAGLFLLGIGQTIPLPRGLLATLSPSTARLYERLLPVEPEVLIDEEQGQSTSLPAGTTLSLYPGVTRIELGRLLAVFLLFAIVRNNMASVGSLRRLSLAALTNGALLTMFGIAQFFTSPPQTLYWTYKVPNAVFGPFVCRNHFAFYTNLSFGLGIGLLLSLLPVGPGQRVSRSLTQLLGNTPALWVASALGLVFCGTLLSLSRGGLLASGGAAVLCLGLWLARPAHPGAFAGRLAAASVIPLLALALVTALGLGLDPMVSRLTVLKGDKEFQESRGNLWSRVLPLAMDFPLWGTGYGTFQYVEPMQRTRGDYAMFVYENAHNDYLEALIEGGLSRLLLSLLAIALVCRAAFRALRHYSGTSAEGLVWGALFAFLTVLIHSGGDFGLHIPAIAVIVTVLCAHLCALGDDTQNTADSVRLPGIASCAAALTALALGLALCGSGWTAHVGESLRLAAAELKGEEDPAQRQARLTYLRAAARRQPGLAAVHLELAQACAEFFDDENKRHKTAEQGRATAQLVADCAALPGLPAALSWSAVAILRGSEGIEVEAEQARTHLIPALHAFLQARAACPLRTEPHLALATHVRLLRKAPPREAYLDRVKYLAPADPQVWYLCGVQEVLDDPSRAFASWRHCLELSDRYLPDILARAGVRDPEEALNLLLPDKASVLLAAAWHLYPEEGSIAERRPLLSRGLHLLETRAEPLAAEEYRIKASLCVALARKNDAVVAYRQALSLQPYQHSWRYDLVRLLLDCGLAREARREVQVILTQRPGDATAGELLQEVIRFISKGS
jgi:O-antigen ligase